MKKILLYSLLVLAILTSCNNELLENEFQTEEEQTLLIPEKITYVIPSSGFESYMNYDDEGFPTTHTNEDNSITNNDFIYENNELKELRTFDGNHGNNFRFYYEANKLDSIFCFCHNGVTSDQRSWSISYNNNQIISNFTSSSNNGINSTSIYTFQSNNYKILTEIESFYQSGQGLTKFYYDENNNPTKMERYSYDEDLMTYELNTVEEQTFDNKINLYSHVQKFNPIIESLYHEIATNESHSFLMPLNRKATNNVLTRKVTFIPNDIVMVDLLFQYTYNEDNYPISYEQTYFGSQLREYYIDYYED